MLEMWIRVHRVPTEIPKSLTPRIKNYNRDTQTVMGMGQCIKEKKGIPENGNGLDSWNKTGAFAKALSLVTLRRSFPSHLPCPQDFVGGEGFSVSASCPVLLL